MFYFHANRPAIPRYQLNKEIGKKTDTIPESAQSAYLSE
jgi:hypothetical protein